MIRFGESTAWLSNIPVESELKRLTIKQLLEVCKRQRGFKTVLIAFLMTKKKLL
jgi:hypothetical protein